jgi:hypothetical protein
MALSVIGAGLPRTGTMSLKLALERLGFGPCLHMIEVIQNQAAAPLWIAAAEGRPDWEAIFAGYASAVDAPSAMFWRTLIEVYPGAKVILTVRDRDRWFASTQATILADEHTSGLFEGAMQEMIETVWFSYLDHRLKDRAHLLDVFARHNAEVRDAVPPERLLVYETGAGWEPLCAFLGVPVPGEPYPHSNTTGEFHARRDARKAGKQPKA